MGIAYVERTAAHKYAISLFKPRGITYWSLVRYLLHEYGHVLDEERYYACARLQLYENFTCPNVQDFPSIPLIGKRAILITEMIAESYVAKLLKKFGMYEKPMERKLKLDCVMQLLTNKYEMTFGVHLSDATSRSIKKTVRRRLSGIVVDKSFCLDPTFEIPGK